MLNLHNVCKMIEKEKKMNLFQNVLCPAVSTSLVSITTTSAFCSWIIWRWWWIVNGVGPWHAIKEIIPSKTLSQIATKASSFKRRKQFKPSEISSRYCMNYWLNHGSWITKGLRQLWEVIKRILLSILNLNSWWINWKIWRTLFRNNWMMQWKK